MRVGCVLLASGFARRFGENKLLCTVEGHTLVERAFDALPPALFDRAVVTSQYPQVLDLAAQRGYLALENRGAEEGIAAGIRLGLAALGPCDGVLFSVCDQPWLTRQSVAALVAAFIRAPSHITALAWAEGRGNPVIFPADLLPQLSALTGEQGGGVVIKAHPHRLTLVQAGSPRELWDVDQPADLPPGERA